MSSLQKGKVAGITEEAGSKDVIVEVEDIYRREQNQGEIRYGCPGNRNGSVRQRAQRSERAFLIHPTDLLMMQHLKKGYMQWELLRALLMLQDQFRMQLVL